MFHVKQAEPCRVHLKMFHVKRKKYLQNVTKKPCNIEKYVVYYMQFTKLRR